MILYTTESEKKKIVNDYVYNNNNFVLKRRKFNENNTICQFFGSCTSTTQDYRQNKNHIQEIIRKHPNAKVKHYTVIRVWQHNNDERLLYTKNISVLDQYYDQKGYLKEEHNDENFPKTRKEFEKEYSHPFDLYACHGNYIKAYSYSTVEVNNKIIFFRLMLHQNNQSRHNGILSAKTLINICDQRGYKLIHDSIVRNMRLIKYEDNTAHFFEGMNNDNEITIWHNTEDLHILFHRKLKEKDYTKMTIPNQKKLEFSNKLQDFDETLGDLFLHNEDVYFSLGDTLFLYLNWQDQQMRKHTAIGYANSNNSSPHTKSTLNPLPTYLKTKEYIDDAEEYMDDAKEFNPLQTYLKTTEYMDDAEEYMDDAKEYISLVFILCIVLIGLICFISNKNSNANDVNDVMN